MQRTILAADLGGTNVRMAAVAPDGSILHRGRRATPESKSRADVIEVLVSLADECREAASEFGPVESLGLAVPAVVDCVSGSILSAPNLPELDGFGIAEELSKRIAIPVTIENDATAAAVGEHWMGASRAFRDVIHVTLGTGVGGGLILDGEPLRGIDGTAGEIGHICVEPRGHPCGCGSNGCVEQYSSGSAVVRIAIERLSAFPNSKLARREGLTALDVYQAGVEGDELAVEVFRTMGVYLGIALAGLVNVLNPEAIVIGGGVSNGWDLFTGHIRTEIERRAFRQPAHRVKLIRASLGDDAGTLGAAYLAIAKRSRSIRNFA